MNNLPALSITLLRWRGFVTPGVEKRGVSSSFLTIDENMLCNIVVVHIKPGNKCQYLLESDSCLFIHMAPRARTQCLIWNYSVSTSQCCRLKQLQQMLPKFLLYSISCGCCKGCVRDSRFCKEISTSCIYIYGFGTFVCKTIFLLRQRELFTYSSVRLLLYFK